MMSSKSALNRIGESNPKVKVTLVKCVLIDPNHSQIKVVDLIAGESTGQWNRDGWNICDSMTIYVIYYINLYNMYIIHFTQPRWSSRRREGQTCIKNTPWIRNGSWRRRFPAVGYVRSTWMEHVGWMLTGSAALKNDSRHSQGETWIYHTSSLNPQDDAADRFSARWVIVDDWNLKIVGFPLCQMVSLESSCSLCRQYMNLHFSINCGQFCSNGFCKIFRLSQLEVNI